MSGGCPGPGPNHPASCHCGRTGSGRLNVRTPAAGSEPEGEARRTTRMGPCGTCGHETVLIHEKPWEKETPHHATPPSSVAERGGLDEQFLAIDRALLATFQWSDREHVKHGLAAHAFLRFLEQDGYTVATPVAATLDVRAALERADYELGAALGNTDHPALAALRQVRSALASEGGE